MARLEGITGGLSGKMGSAVFRQSGGKTIASQYQPIVKNPNTGGQQNTRAAFKLMSQLAAVMKDGFGTMGINERPARGRMSQRNAFFKLNFPLVQVTKETSGVVAKIPMDKLQLTSSFRPLPPFGTRETEAHPDKNLVFIQNINPEVSAVRIVSVNYRQISTENNAKQAFIEAIADAPVNNGTVDFEMEVPTRQVGDQITILGFGLIPTASASKKIDLDNIHTPADENFISAIKLDQMVSDGLMTETMTVGINITVKQE